MGTKQRDRDPADPDDDHRGDSRDSMAFGSEHKLVWVVAPGARAEENALAIVAAVHQRVGSEPPPLSTSDEYPAYATALAEVFSEPVPAPSSRRPGRPRVVPEGRLPDVLTDAAVHKRRENNWGIAVEQWRVFGSPEGLEEAPDATAVSHRVNTSFIERHNGTDRGRNAPKAHKAYRFSKDGQVHEAMTYSTRYSSNFCGCVRTLRVKDKQGRSQGRSPALAARLTDHGWTWQEWFNRSAVQST